MDLSDGGEIVQASLLAPVPLTRPWFVGLANIRGNLHAVADFSMFCGGGPTARNNNARLLLVGTRHSANASLLVSRMLGLKNPEDFTEEAADPAAVAWEVARFSDTQGRIWRKLSVRALLDNHEFMNIGV